MLWVLAVVVMGGRGQASRGACAVESGCFRGCRCGRCQAGAGNAESSVNAAVRSCAQGHEACRRSVAVRAWNARRAATCNRR